MGGIPLRLRPTLAAKVAAREEVDEALRQRHVPNQLTVSLWLLVSTLLSVAASPAVLQAQTGLVAAWSFNEGTGTTAADASGNNNTGAISGATWSTQGRFGNALNFDGVNDVVLVNSSASLNLTTGMTLSAWVYPTANQGQWRAIVQKEVDAYLLHASNSSGALRPAAGGTFSGTGKTVAAPSAIAVNAWTHLAVTYDAATIRLFVNGTQVATTARTGSLETNTKPLRIGGNSPYGEFFLGRIDDVRIYNRALTATQIQNDMAVSVGGGGPPDVTVPTVTVTTPTANPTLTVSTTPLTLSGTAGDNVAVTQVSWASNRGGSGIATGTTAWSTAGIPLLTGDNVLTVTARDAAANVATDVLTVTYSPPDATVPTVTITTPTVDPTLTVITTPLTLGGTADDNVAVTQVSWTNDRGGSGIATGTTAWSAPSIALLAGDNVLTITARDAAGNLATDVLTVTYSPPPDVTVPTVTITTPTANPTLTVATTPVTLGGTAGDNVAVTQVSWTHDRGGSGIATGTTAWSAPSIALLAGDNVLTVTARDAAGNVATAVLTVTYAPDVTVPTVAITTPTANPTLAVTTTPLTLGGTADDNVAVTQVSWTNDRGGSGIATGTTAWSVASIALLAGDNVVTVTARDAAGNVATDVLTVTYTPPPDTTVPTVTITTPTANPTLTVTATPLTLGGTAGDNVGVTQVSWTSSRGGSGTATGTTAWSAVSIVLLTGDNVLTVTARDAAGNTATDVLTVTYQPPTGLVAAWGFNEGMGTTVSDVSGNNNMGTISGATWSPLGRYGNALNFDGVNDVVLVNSSASLNLTTGMTLSAWVYPTATQNEWRAIVQREVDAYLLHASNSSGALRPAAGGTFSGTGKTVVAPSAIAVNAWTHLAVTYDAATIRLFVNGTQVASAARTGSLETNTKPLRIGGNSPYGEFFLGRIDEVRIYNRALTATEIQSDMAVSVSPAAPRLILLQPVAGSVIMSTTVAVAYSATGDLTEVNHVHFTLDANPEVMDLSFDWAFQFTNVLVGPHVLTGYLVRADHSKIPGTDASVSFTTAGADSTPPSVAITAPASGASLTGTVTVTATASDNSGTVAGVQFFLDGTPLGPEITTAPYSSPWNTQTVGNGPHSVTARARDGSGNQRVSTAVAVTVTNSTSSAPSVVGLWSQVLDWPLVAIHMTLMPDGKVLVWDDHTDATGAGVFDPATLAVTVRPYLGANLFCAGHNLLPDGRVFVAGGHNGAHIGITNGTIFNPPTQSWTAAQPMAVARWYPTVTTLPDGGMLTIGGEIACDNCNAPVPEVFNPATGTWTPLSGAPLDLPYYPHAFVLPDGRILVTGANKREIPTYALNVATQVWTTVDPTVLHAGSSVMYTPGKVMKSGRGRDPDLPGEPSVATTYVLDMTAPAPHWRQTASMAFPRTEHNLTLLADGTVLTIGGGGNSDVFDPNTPVLQPELWDPATEIWTLMAPMQRPRIYHSTAVLLPDGRVLSAGGGRWGPSYLDAQFYSPPYLFKGPRPTIASAPATVGYTADFFVGTSDAANISAVTLLRLGSVTHAFDANQRFLKLTFQPGAGGLTVQAPAAATLAPPGHYMLFILDANGVPSVASIVKIQ